MHGVLPVLVMDVLMKTADIAPEYIIPEVLSGDMLGQSVPYPISN